MKTVIITQKDNFFIPKNIQRLILSKESDIKKIYIVNSKGSLINKKTIFIYGFGISQSAKMAFKIILNYILITFDYITFFKILRFRKNINSLARNYAISLEFISDPNEPSIISEIKKINPEIIVSFSAPIVFRKPLLDIPKFGCINLHCSLLPKYAGLLPSFWVLYNGENQTGATIHYMDSKIDNGLILNQESIEINKSDSMFEVLKKTKNLGGILMIKTITQLNRGKNIIKQNNVNKGSYNTWPTINQIKSFSKRGGKLV